MNTTDMIQKIQFELDDGQRAGEALKEIPSKAELRKKGFRAAIPFWLAAIPSAFIPLLHFILVPMLLVIGFVQGRTFWKGRAMFNQGKVSCPRCQNKIGFDGVPEERPLKILCESCGYQLRLYEAAP